MFCRCLPILSQTDRANWGEDCSDERVTTSYSSKKFFLKRSEGKKKNWSIFILPKQKDKCRIQIYGGSELRSLA